MDDKPIREKGGFLRERGALNELEAVGVLRIVAPVPSEFDRRACHDFESELNR